MPRSWESWARSETLKLVIVLVAAVVVLAIVRKELSIESIVAGLIALAGGVFRIIKGKDGG